MKVTSKVQSKLASLSHSLTLSYVKYQYHPGNFSLKHLTGDLLEKGSVTDMLCQGDTQ